MKIQFDNNDVLEFASPEERMILEGKGSEESLGDGMKISRVLIKVITKSLASLGRNMEGDFINLDQMTVKLEIEGKPFNIGLGGSVEYVFKTN